MITLENDFLKIDIAAKGAELQKLFHKGTGIDYLWDANPAYWAKHSPILFPVVGALRDGYFEYKDHQYELPRHGFARDHVFKAVQTSAASAEFTLTETEETLTVYPFPFKLKVIYQLEGSQLQVRYEVVNTGATKLLFSLGAHPAFAVPNTAGTVYSDYYLDFNRDQALTSWKLDDGLVATVTETLPLEEGRLKLEHRLFYQDALVFKNLKSDRISLRNTQNETGLDFDFEGFPFFGIWAAPDAPFVCLEPWCGVADSVEHDHQLEQKEGIVALEPGKKWMRSWSVTCF